MKAYHIMRLKFPDRDYDGKLLGRLLKKGLQQHFCSGDDHAMSKFIDKGNEIRQSGGVFEFILSSDSRVA
jgi:hypothetical protein